MTARRRRAPGGPRALVPVLVPIDKLRPDPANARRHPLANLADIEASLREFGQIKPIVTSKNLTIVAGGGTYQAAQNLGWVELGAIVFPGTVEQARAYAIADNRSAELAEWDLDILVQTLDVLPEGLADATGFAPDDRELLRAALDADEGGGREVRFTAHDKPEAEHQCPKCGHRWRGDSAPND